MITPIIETGRVKLSSRQASRRLWALMALFAPLTLCLLVIFSDYEWIWYRTDHAIAAGLVALLLSWLCMCAGLAMWGLSRISLTRWATRLALVMVIGQVFSFGIDSLSAVHARQSLADGSEALAVGRGGFGSYWADVYVTERRWVLLRNTYAVVQFDKPVVEGLTAAADGGFDVRLSEYGKPGWVEHFSPTDIAAARARAAQRCRFC